MGNSGEDEAGKGILDSEAEPEERSVARKILDLRWATRKTRTPFKEIADENGDNGEGRGNGQLVEEDGSLSNANRDSNSESGSEAARFEVVDTPDIKDCLVVRFLLPWRL